MRLEELNEVKLVELGVYFAPVVLFFRDGKLIKKLEGIKELLC